ncbi:MAG: cyclase family protein [bacterium]
MNKNPVKWIDITVTIKDGMVHWPSDPAIEVKKVSEIKKGDSYNITSLSLGAHSGTHIDAPLHILKDGKGIIDIPFSATIGLARVIKISDPESIKVDELYPHKISKGEKILFKTINSEHCWKKDTFFTNFVYLSQQAAQYLVDCGVTTVGVDYLSVGGYKKNGKEVHNILLSSGVWIIEGLNLSNVNEGDYELICLPLKIEDADGSPCRAILKKLRPTDRK